MTSSRHIFIQVDTDKIVKFANKVTSPKKPINAEAYSRLYDQGSMVIGDSIRMYDVLVKPEEDLQFTILPHRLFSFHKLYFYRFEEAENGLSEVIDNLSSLKLEKKYMPNPGDRSFSLYAILEYTKGPNTIQTHLCIDPVLRADQGN